MSPASKSWNGLSDPAPARDQRPAMAANPCLVVVDDNPDDRVMVRRVLEKEVSPCTIVEVASSAALDTVLREGAFDAVITDFHLTWSDGLHVLRAVKERWPDRPVIMFTGTGTEEIAVEAMKCGLDDYVLKSPKHLIRLPAALRGAFERTDSRKRARELESRLRDLLDRLDVGVFRASLDGRLLEGNAAIVRALGYAAVEEGKAVDIRELFTRPEARLELLDRLQAEGSVHGFETEVRLPDGTNRWVRLTEALVQTADGQPVIDGVLEDVTERRKLEAQLLHAQRMEAVGRLAGGVAHDINNVLTAIMGATELVLLEEDLPRMAQAFLDEIKTSVARAGALTGQLLTFSRRQVEHPRVVDLNEVVLHAQRMLERLIGEDVELEVHLDPGAGSVRIDPVHLEQVLLNLVINARDAMPAGGRLSISTTAVEVDGGGLPEGPALQPGRFVALDVADTGHGMTDQVRARIFEPFFTTKEVGRGTGLGLATAREIVGKGGGGIVVDSEPGHGATFRILLPRVDAVLDSKSSTADGGMPVGGSETLLIVEDDFSVRSVVATALRHLGYAVLEAPTPERALAVARAHAGPLHLLLTDVVMPGMCGSELAQRLLAERPGLPAIFMTGHASDVVAAQGIVATDVALVQKPFGLLVLARAVRTMLDAAGAHR